jgi:regulator of sigma E protease
MLSGILVNRQNELDTSSYEVELNKELVQKSVNINALRDDVPESIVFAISKALSKVPDERYSSCEEFARDLGIMVPLNSKFHSDIAVAKSSSNKEITNNDLAKKMLISLVKLAKGNISVKNLGGPVLIASVAGKSLDAGIIPFLQMMALISINLFLLNLFPVPVLDGGHLLFFVLEAIKGKPVSIRTMEIANQIGMVLILMLVGLTLFNDITRIILH